MPAPRGPPSIAGFQEGFGLAIRVMVKNNEPLEKTLRRLRKICNNEGITRDLKRSAYYEKPSERRRRKERERIKNLRKADRPEKEKKDKKKDKEKKERREPRM